MLRVRFAALGIHIARGRVTDQPGKTVADLSDEIVLRW
jgi:hypothetical protein